MDREDLRKKAASFPDAPGVYIMRDARGEEIYVGKALSVRRRLLSYFRPGGAADAKTTVLVDTVRDVDVIPTDSEVEALLLESRLIKELKPKFNIELKWGERYPWLVVRRRDDFPLVEITRDVSIVSGREDEILFRQRFPRVGDLRAALRVLQKIFRFRTCRLHIREEDAKRRSRRPCLLYHVERCSAPCAARIGKAEYEADIARFVAFLGGRDKEKVAAELESAMREASRGRRYEDAARLRDELFLLRDLAASRVEDDDVPFPAPLADPSAAMDELGRVLGLDRTPLRIEGIDVSHTGGSNAVGALVSFVNGMPCREEYRRYRIKTARGGDDPAGIREVVSRRLRRLSEEGKEPPDLFLVDGGRAQLSAACGAVREHGAEERTHAAALAKEFEELYVPGRKGPIRLPATSPALKLACRVRDEAHRFARLYHALLRGKDLAGGGRKGKGK